jgi:CheY-like chemotaxis protein
MAKILLLGGVTKTFTELQGKLEKLSHEVILSTSTRQFLEILEADRAIDLVIAEMASSNYHDFDFLPHLKRSPRLQAIPVIFCSTAWDHDTVHYCAEMGVNSILALPVTDEVLGVHVFNALRNGRPTVLLVDDELLILDVLRQHLEIERFNVYTTTSGEDALRLIDTHRIDIVVCDVMLPGISGLDLLVTIKEKYEGMPVVLITNYKPEEAISAGADGYLAKPFKNKEMVNKLRGLLQRKPVPAR